MCFHCAASQNLLALFIPLEIVVNIHCIGYVYRLAGLLLATLVLTIVVSPASADPSRDGYGLFIADDETNWGDPSTAVNISDDFSNLNPKLYRLQIIWNAKEPAPANPTQAQIDSAAQRAAWVVRTHALIDAAKLRGVENIVLTLRANHAGNVGTGGYVPTATRYELEARKVVQDFASKVDVWGGINEPNLWKTGANSTGAIPVSTLVDYQAGFTEVVDHWDSSATITSPDFNDETANWNGYATNYQNAGGGWGDVAAFHPYAAAATQNLSTINQYAAIVPGNRDIWVTEVGTHFNGNPAAQAVGVEWIAKGQAQCPNANACSLASHDRVKRIAYYHMRDNNPTWDTALLNADLTRRLAWYKWCSAAHGDNAAHGDCAEISPPVDQPIVKDWDGDGTDTVGVFNSGEWCLSNTPALPTACDIRIQAWGASLGDKPLVGDWNGNDTDTVGVYNAGEWCLSNAPSPSSCDIHVPAWGQAVDTPLVGDWNGNGVDTAGVYNSGEWCLSNHPTNPTACDIRIYTWGTATGDKPIVGDWDGNGTDTVGIYNSGEWCLSNHPTNPTTCDIRIHSWGS